MSLQSDNTIRVFMRMIDKLECPIELGKPFTKEALEIRAAVRSLATGIPFQKSKYYAAVFDLREVMGVDALLHVQSRYGNHNDKLELLHTGGKSWGEMMSTVSRIYDGNPEDLQVRRTDLCCDVDVSMDWIARSVRAQYKRIEFQFGEVEMRDGQGKRVDFIEIGKRRLETVQFGRKPNPLRIYDKVAETMSRYLAAKRLHSRVASGMVADAAMDGSPYDGAGRNVKRGIERRLRGAAGRMHPFPSFVEWSGGLREQQTLTRIERQIHGRIPPIISNVRQMHKNVLEFNPFERLHFVAPDAKLEVSEDDYSPVQWLAGVKMMELLQSGEWSCQQLTKFIGRNGNRKKTEQKFTPFLRAGSMTRDGEKELMAAELYERYRESIERQLTA
jgi:hypothetical protein